MLVYQRVSWLTTTLLPRPCHDVPLGPEQHGGCRGGTPRTVRRGWKAGEPAKHDEESKGPPIVRKSLDFFLFVAVLYYP